MTKIETDKITSNEKEDIAELKLKIDKLEELSTSILQEAERVGATCARPKLKYLELVEDLGYIVNAIHIRFYTGLVAQRTMADKLAIFEHMAKEDILPIAKNAWLEYSHSVMMSACKKSETKAIGRAVGSLESLIEDMPFLIKFVEK